MVGAQIQVTPFISLLQKGVWMFGAVRYMCEVDGATHVGSFIELGGDGFDLWNGWMHYVTELV